MVQCSYGYRDDAIKLILNWGNTPDIKNWPVVLFYRTPQRACRLGNSLAAGLIF